MIQILSDAFKLPDSEHDKITSPENTVELFKNRVKSTGLNILKETRRIDNNRLGIPVYYSVCGHDASSLTGTKKQMGKGITPALAEASAVMELAERFSLYSFMNNTSNFINANYDQIKELCYKKEAQPIPFALILHSVHEDKSYTTNTTNRNNKNDGSDAGNNNNLRDNANKNRDKFNDEDIIIRQKIFSLLELQWTHAYNYSKKQEVYIPFDWFFMINEFNGSSAGNCNEEAICQGGCEIIERHVSALVCRDKILCPYIDPSSVTNPSTLELIRKFTNAGIKFYISDFSLNTGIPTVGVIAWDPSTFPKSSEIVWTAGTAPNPDKALSRALTEVAQLAGDFNTRSNYVASGLPKFTSLEQASWLIDPIEKGLCPKVNISDLPDISSQNIKDEIISVIKAMELIGLELIVVNTTDPRLKIPACYTIVPGAYFRERAENSSIAMFAARHIHKKFAPEKAFSLLQKIDATLPKRYEVQFYLGLCLLDMEKPDQAIYHLQAAMELNPALQDIPSICSYTGVCLKELGEYKQAIEVLNIGIDADNERDDIYNLMGFCYFMLKEHQKSISCFENVLKLNPSSAIDHASIGSNYRELGNIEKAIVYYELALALDPTLEFARQNLEKLNSTQNSNSQ